LVVLIHCVVLESSFESLGLLCCKLVGSLFEQALDVLEGRAKMLVLLVNLVQLLSLMISAYFVLDPHRLNFGLISFNLSVKLNSRLRVVL
jgi:hypothetical protein